MFVGYIFRLNVPISIIPNAKSHTQIKQNNIADADIPKLDPQQLENIFDVFRDNEIHGNYAYNILKTVQFPLDLDKTRSDDRKDNSKKVNLFCLILNWSVVFSGLLINVYLLFNSNFNNIFVVGRSINEYNKTERGKVKNDLIVILSFAVKGANLLDLIYDRPKV